MKIILLTHERELNKRTNTGSIAIEHAGKLVERVMWQRTNPDERLVQLIASGEAVLLHQERDDTSAVRIDDFENVIIIDSTWQESRKIVNKSQYLKQAPLATLKVAQESCFKLRRNQVKGGLCTIECVIEVLKIKRHFEVAEKLAAEFARFNQ